MIVIAVDPGKTTGLAVFSYEPGTEPVLKSSGEYEVWRFVEELQGAILLARSVNETAEIVCERFVINAQTIKNSQAPFSIEQIGITKYVMYQHGIDPDRLIFQAPSDAKKMFPNDALRRLGYWTVGTAGHDKDAMRHGLLRLVKKGWVPRRLLEDR